MKTFLISIPDSTPIHVEATSKEEALAWCAKYGIPVTDISDDTANVKQKLG